MPSKPSLQGIAAAVEGLSSQVTPFGAFGGNTIPMSWTREPRPKSDLGAGFSATHRMNVLAV
jgi:hypothetical protein